MEIKSSLLLKLLLLVIAIFLALSSCTNPWMASILGDREKPETTTISVSGVTLNKTATSIIVGETETLTATVKPDDATNQNVIWISSNNSVATVTDGFVAAVSDGTATITVTTADSGHTATCAVTVIDWNKEDFGLGAVIEDPFTVANTAQWNNAVSIISSGGNDKNYIINVINDFDVPGAVGNPPDATFGTTTTGIKVSLRGEDRTLTLSGNGKMICIGIGQEVILRSLTLRGHSSNNTSLVEVVGEYEGYNWIGGGIFTMRSGEISGNTGEQGGGVRSEGTFTMHGGKISDNSGGGVNSNGIFMMHGGEISGNTTYSGGGVHVNNGTFTMHGGKISGNTATTSGGVHVNATFMMYDGEISSNTATDGGGVGVGGSFTMYGGKISGNTATDGGGVFIWYSGSTFRIVTGTIYGSNEANPSLRNTATIPGSAALMNRYNEGTAQYGTFNGGNWNGTAIPLNPQPLPTPGWAHSFTDDTIKVVEGNLIQ